MDDIKKRLAQIAEEMKKPGADQRKLSKELDRLLGTNVEAMEDEIDGHSQPRNRRKQREDVSR